MNYVLTRLRECIPDFLNKWREGDDSEMQQIAKDEEEWVKSAFENCVNEEKRWAEYLFKDGSMIGLNDKLLHQYVEWIANRRMKSIGIKPIYDIPAKNNRLTTAGFYPILYA